MLFALVTNSVREADLQKRCTQRVGLSFWYEDEERFIRTTHATNILFADDETLIATSCHELQKMIDDVACVLAEVGLELSVQFCTIKTTSCIRDF